jgi:hypothetical protein
MTPRRCDIVSVVLISLGTNLFSSILTGTNGDFIFESASYALIAGLFIFILGAVQEDTYYSVVNSCDLHVQRNGGDRPFAVLALERFSSRSLGLVVCPVLWFICCFISLVLLVVTLFSWYQFKIGKSL